MEYIMGFFIKKNPYILKDIQNVQFANIKKLFLQ
nr:MAG TPA: hypothetical protein [Caudoviricetes sp.]